MNYKRTMLAADNKSTEPLRSDQRLKRVRTRNVSARTLVRAQLRRNLAPEQETLSA